MVLAQIYPDAPIRQIKTHSYSIPYKPYTIVGAYAVLVEYIRVCTYMTRGVVSFSLEPLPATK